MKFKVHKNQVVIATLAVLIAIAGYITYDKTGGNLKENDKQASAEKNDKNKTWDELVWSDDNTEIVSDTEDLNPGESVLTGTILNPTEYASGVKLNREKIRASNKEALLEIINNKEISDEVKKEAIQKMIDLTDIAEKEANAEMLLRAKGFSNVVVSISENNCDVVLDMGKVTDAKRAQVEDIVKRKTGIAANKIVITPINDSK